MSTVFSTFNSQCPPQQQHDSWFTTSRRLFLKTSSSASSVPSCGSTRLSTHQACNKTLSPLSWSYLPRSSITIILWIDVKGPVSSFNHQLCFLQTELLIVIPPIWHPDHVILGNCVLKYADCSQANVYWKSQHALQKQTSALSQCH